ncbi:MAG TPA: GNAT family N-acetyltransferase [Candidatus Limnocylindrales bacterium]|nr:GNAT family N-acetyltransferase [Candidatus Limnocylindrales bacterium]
MEIRESVIEDIARVDPIRRETFPWHVASVATQENWFRHNPPEGKPLRLSAFADGKLVGFGSASLNVMAANPGEGNFYLIVDPRYRGRGIGKQIHDRLLEHLREIGVHRTQAHALDSPEVLEWVQRQGFELGASERWSMVDPRELPPMPDVPPGVEIVGLHEIGPEVAHAVDTEAFLDEPGDVANGGMPYETFLNSLWNAPDFDREVSVAAIVDGVAAATTNLEVNSATGKAMSSGTSTLRPYRGRGLAKLMKSVSLRRAADKGVTAAYTCNDYTNAPMLAINDWLGYKVIGGGRSVLKKV